MRNLLFAVFCLATIAVNADDARPTATSPAVPQVPSVTIETAEPQTESRRLLEQKLKALEKLQDEVRELGITTGIPTRVRFSWRAVELDRFRLKQLGRPHPFRTFGADQPDQPPADDAIRPALGISYAKDDQLFKDFEPLVAQGCAKLLASSNVIAQLGQSTTVNFYRDLPRVQLKDEVDVSDRTPGFGIELLARREPDGDILLVVSSQIVEEDIANSVTHNGRIIPGISRRRAQSTVRMKSGGTLILGGMISSRERDGEQHETEFVSMFSAEYVPEAAVSPQRVR